MQNKKITIQNSDITIQKTTKRIKNQYRDNLKTWCINTDQYKTIQ